MPRFLILILFILPQYLTAQKQTLTLDDAVYYGFSKYRPTSLSNLQWSADQNTLYFTKQNNWLYAYNPQKNKLDSVDIVAGFNRYVGAKEGANIKAIPAFIVSAGNKMKLQYKGKSYTLNLSNGAVLDSLDYPSAYKSIEVSPASGAISYTKDNALWVLNPDGRKAMVAQGSDSIVYGESVHRDEFGINKGMFWSPDGQYLAFYRMDQSMVTRYPIYQLQDTPATVRYIYYPVAGAKSHHVTLGVYNRQDSSIRYMNTDGDPEHYLTNICWNPDSKTVYIAEINRGQNHTRMNAYDVSTGNLIKTLYEERSEKYTEPLVPFTFVPLHDDWFIAQSKRDGWNTLYLYNSQGALLRALSMNLEVTEINGFDNKSKFVYFTAIAPDAIDKQLYKSELSTGKVSQLTRGAGQHSASVSYDGKYIADQHISLQQPMIYTVTNSKSGKSHTLFQSIDPLANVNIGKIEIDTLRADDGTRLYTRTIFPYDFDPHKKYPAVIYVYGGPHAQMLTNTRLAQAPMWMPYMANQGFIIFTLDNRGSSNRGLKFENVTFRHLGDTEIKDQMVGYDYLASQPWVDNKKIGVHGWSFGGFMTMSLMTREPGKFAAAVAGGPVTDWRLYEIMYTERYMDTPQENPEGYNKARLDNYIDNLNGPMLLIHGTSDPVVLWQHTLNYLKACVDKGKQLDYFVYPGHEHNVLGKDRIHLIRKIIDYFEDHLK